MLPDPDDTIPPDGNSDTLPAPPPASDSGLTFTLDYDDEESVS